MSSPLLTIIIATFNGSRTLQRTLDSILSQDWQEWEVLIVDGASGDDTVKIIEENAGRDNRIRFFSEKDKGVYDAMNKGIGLARGHWVYFLGCDDWLLDRQVLQAVFSEPNISGYDLVYGNVTSTSYKGLYDGAFTFEKLLSRNISHQAIFYKKSLFDRIGDYNLRYRAHADWDLNIRCFLDSSIREKYLEVAVAGFGADGISSQHDIPFLREVLVPEKLRMLVTGGISRLRSVPAYDQWWRLIRNAGVRGVVELEGLAGGDKNAGESTGGAVKPYELTWVTGQSGEVIRGDQSDELRPGEKVPRCLKNMVRWQQPVPPKLLRVGALSKSLMFASYLLNRLTGAI